MRVKGAMGRRTDHTEWYGAGAAVEGPGAVGDGRLAWAVAAGLGLLVAAAFGTGHRPSIVELVLVLAVAIPLLSALVVTWLRCRHTVRMPIDPVTAPPAVER